MERLRITINFKHTPEDVELYNELQKYSCVSGYIKDVLRGVLSATAPSKETKGFSRVDDISDSIEDILGD